MLLLILLLVLLFIYALMVKGNAAVRKASISFSGACLSNQKQLFPLSRRPMAPSVSTICVAIWTPWSNNKHSNISDVLQSQFYLGHCVVNLSTHKLPSPPTNYPHHPQTTLTTNTTHLKQRYKKLHWGPQDGIVIPSVIHYIITVLEHYGRSSMMGVLPSTSTQMAVNSNGVLHVIKLEVGIYLMHASCKSLSITSHPIGVSNYGVIQNHECYHFFPVQQLKLLTLLSKYIIIIINIIIINFNII